MKKALSLLLCIVLMLGSVGSLFTAIAADPTSGSCGTNLTWSYNQTTATLTISGTGEMSNYSSIDNKAPWEPYCETMQTLVINNGVTSIGDFAFDGCTGLTSVTIGNNVTSIGNSAFFSCFSLKSFSVSASNPSFSTDAYGVLYNKNKTELLLYPAGSSRSSFTIPGTVTCIASLAFGFCFALTNVTIPASVTRIRWQAFYLCTGLTSVTIPDGVIYIEPYTFAFCQNLAEVTIGSGVQSIGEDAFLINVIGTMLDEEMLEEFKAEYQSAIQSGETEIEGSPIQFIKAIIDHPNGSLTDVYYNGTRSAWNTIQIDETNEALLNARLHFNGSEPTSGSCGPNLTWQYDKNTKTLTISGTGAMFDYSATEETYEVVEWFFDEVEIPRTTAPWHIYAEEIETVDIQNGVTAIGSFAFLGCLGITGIKLGNSVTSIGDYAFAGCTNLKSLAIPDSVRNLGEMILYLCVNLTDVSLGNGITSIEPGFFTMMTKLKKVTLGNNVRSIDEHTFAFCYSLESITIPDSVRSIGDEAFVFCASLTDVKLGSGITSIGESAFGMCTSLKSITIPDGVTSIGDYAFSGCVSMTSVTIPASLKTIGEAAFMVSSEGESLDELRTAYNQAVAAGETMIGEIPIEAAKMVLDHPYGSLTDVYYRGRRAQWNAIRIGQDNASLLRARLHCIDDASEIVQAVSLADATVSYKGKASLKPTITAGENAKYTVSYSSSNPNVVNVNEKTGEVSGLKKGAATITCTVTDQFGNTFTDTCTVTVNYTWWQWIIVIVLFGWLWY